MYRISFVMPWSKNAAKIGVSSTCIENGDVYDNALLVEGVKPRVMLACHCHSSTEACRAHNLPKQKQGVRESYL